MIDPEEKPGYWEYSQAKCQPKNIYFHPERLQF
jgi:hypothetical protein